MLILAPKPPPTSGAMARTWCWPRPFIAAIIVFRMCGFCVDDQMVIVSLPGSQCATTPRGSIAFGTRRWFIMRWVIDDLRLGKRLVDGGVVDRRAVGRDAGAARHQRRRRGCWGSPGG